ncbi:MAG: TIGR04211 family SH3 domain-containing protein [Bacteroidetes bacterium]|nr:TIGR04211 family SH3 domain-containing protein [Bacteroidota bacterium]
MRTDKGQSRQWCRAAVGAVCLGLASAAPASYITDQLEVPMRSGESTEYRILRFLPSGADVTVLEQLPSGYSRIQDAAGREGYVLTRYVLETPPAATRLPALTQQLAAAQADLSRMQAELEAAVRARNTALDAQREAERTAQKATTDYQALVALSGDAVRLKARTEALEAERILLANDNESLKSQNLALKDDATKEWFILGALTLGAGWLLGLIIPLFKRRRIDRRL